MRRPITRRDLLNGLSVAVAAGVLPRTLIAQSISEAGTRPYPGQGLAHTYYPPLLSGIRGNHEGSYEVAHNLARRGLLPNSYEELEEHYDLVVVGGGISGLACAYLYQQQRGDNPRILILDNHDDFGGHAKRNEFHSGGKMYLGFGGSQNLEYSENYSANARQLLQEIGVDFDALGQANDPSYPFVHLDQPIGMFLQRGDSGEIVNGDWLAALLGEEELRPLIEQLDLPEDEKERLISLCGGEVDYLEGFSLTEKWEYVNSTAYNDFLVQRVGLSSTTLSLSDNLLRANYSVGGDCLSVVEAIAGGAPGLRALGWLANFVADWVVDADELYSAKYFPDGNASIARLLVRKLIPAVAPGKDMQDIAAAKFDYTRLDQAQHSVRLRLNSTAVQVKNTTTGQVDIAYVDTTGGVARNYRVSADHCILACYNSIIPSLCPQLPAQQKEHLKYGVKCPLLYVNVLLRDGGVIKRAGVKQFSCPTSYFDMMVTAPLTTMNDFSTRVVEGEPLVLFMGNTPSPQRETPDQSARDLYKLGRYKLLKMPFSDYEDQVKSQLNAMFGPLGFNAERDVEAITVNRWSHGYAYDYMQLFDPQWPAGQAPHELGRKPLGNISIANSDSQAYAYVDGAIDAAWRAVGEQLSASKRQA